MRIPSSKRLIATCACTSNSIQCAARSRTGYRWTFRIVKSGPRDGTTRKPERLAERPSALARTSNPPGWRPASEPELVIVATTVLLDIHSASTPSLVVPSDILMFALSCTSCPTSSSRLSANQGGAWTLSSCGVAAGVGRVGAVGGSSPQATRSPRTPTTPTRMVFRRNCSLLGSFRGPTGPPRRPRGRPEPVVPLPDGRFGQLPTEGVGAMDRG